MTDELTRLREMLAEAKAIGGGLKVVPSEGKPIIISDRGGNLFRGYIATWAEADLIVAAVNALPGLLDIITDQRERLERIEAETIERAARVAESRHEYWRMPHPDDAQPGEVCCDVSACADIASAIRALSHQKDNSDVR